MIEEFRKRMDGYKDGLSRLSDIALMVEAETQRSKSNWRFSLCIKEAEARGMTRRRPRTRYDLMVDKSWFAEDSAK